MSECNLILNRHLVKKVCNLDATMIPVIGIKSLVDANVFLC